MFRNFVNNSRRENIKVSMLFKRSRISRTAIRRVLEVDKLGPLKAKINRLFADTVGLAPELPP